MASLGEVHVPVVIDIEPFEWKVLFVVTASELEKTLNEYSQSGWDVFDVHPGFHVILRKQINQSAES